MGRPIFKFSLKVSLICGFLAAAMLYASYWQYTRYLAKINYIETLNQRLKTEISPLSELLQQEYQIDDLIHRKVSASGNWDYQHEFIIVNRKHNERAGVYVVTPLKLPSSLSGQFKADAILVNRGFLPLSAADPKERLKYQNGPETSFNALVKPSVPKKFMAPSDRPSGLDLPWVDSWYRVNIPEIAKQIPYSLMPFYLEILPENHSQLDAEKMLQTKSDKDQILFMPRSGATLHSIENDLENISYPAPAYDTVIPPGRHFSYIFEWAIMAAMVVTAGIILQLKRN